MRTPTTTTRLLAAAAATALVTAGCGGDGDESAAPTPTATATAVATTEPTSPATAPTPSPTRTSTSEPTAQPTSTTTWATCTNDRADVTLQASYPQDWAARDYPDGGGCSYFDPEPFQVEQGTEASGIAIRLDIESVAYETVREGYLRGDVQSQRDTAVAGFPGVRIEDEDTEGPTAPKGERLTYLADLGNEQTLVLTTNETDADRFVRAREVVDEMADRMSRAS